jgi:hypothetical protein
MRGLLGKREKKKKQSEEKTTAHVQVWRDDVTSGLRFRIGGAIEDGVKCYKMQWRDRSGGGGGVGGGGDNLKAEKQRRTVSFWFVGRDDDQRRRGGRVISDDEVRASSGKNDETLALLRHALDDVAFLRWVDDQVAVAKAGPDDDDACTEDIEKDGDENDDGNTY